MTPRDRLALLVSGVIVVLAATWILLVAPQRTAVATARQSLAAAQVRQATARATERTTGARTASSGDDMAVAAELGKAVPADDDTTSLGVQLQQLARRSDVTFQSIAVAGGGGDPAAAATTTTATTPATTTPAAPAATTPAGAPASTTPAAATEATGLPPGTVVGPAGYTTLPLDLSFTGRYLDVQELLQRLAGLVAVHADGRIDVRGRLLTVEGFSLTTSGASRSRLQASVSGTAYLAPEDLALVAAIQGRADVALTPAPQTPAASAPSSSVSAG